MKIAEASQSAVLAPPETVRRERVLPHPPRRVWRALTRPEAIAKWLLPLASVQGSDTDRPLTAPGESVTLRATPSVRISYEVAEMDPERRLSLWWRVEPLGSVEEVTPTRVTWTLIPEQDGSATRLILEHAPAPGRATALLNGAMARLAVYLEYGRLWLRSDNGVRKFDKEKRKCR